MMSYVIDVYRGDAAAQNFVSFGAYVALFPQLVAGPIVRYTTIADQLDNRRESTDMFAYGIKRFVAGLAKRFLLANTIGQVWTQLSAMEVSSMSVVGTWVWSFGILRSKFILIFLLIPTWPLVLDKCLVLNFSKTLIILISQKALQNFGADGISHWELGLENTYIFRLGGNRKGLIRQIFNLVYCVVLYGLLARSQLELLIWGGYYGVLLIIEKLFLLKVLKKIPAFFSHVYNPCFCCNRLVILALTI